MRSEEQAPLGRKREPRMRDDGKISSAEAVTGSQSFQKTLKGHLVLMSASVV